MVKPICKDILLLSLKALPATEMDQSIGKDLLDTLVANGDKCVGMAANMIGINKAIIVFNDNGKLYLMYNPTIKKKSGMYRTMEGCLSLTGERECERYRSIQVRYQDESFKWKEKTFKDFTAEIIQHEIDHLSGIII